MRLRRVKEIPQFLQRPAYKIDIGLLDVKRWIHHAEMLGQVVDLSPDFQRGKVWAKDQQISYLEYILRGGLSAREIFWNNPDFFTSSRQPLVLVDGKQRLSALFAFLNGKLSLFGTKFKEFEDRKLMNRKTLTFYVNTLETKSEVLEWYLNLNTTGTPHDKEQIKKVEKLAEIERQPYRKD